MIKSVFKEIGIMLLLCIAIALILGVLFYDYIPTNKAVPNKLAAYVTPEDVKKEIDEEIVEKNKTEVSYQITGSDLSLYKQTHGYTSGKVNPFAPSPSTEKVEEKGGTSGNSNTGSTSTNTNVDPKSSGTFFDNKGLK